MARRHLLLLWWAAKSCRNGRASDSMYECSLGSSAEPPRVQQLARKLTGATSASLNPVRRGGCPFRGQGERCTKGEYPLRFSSRLRDSFDIPDCLWPTIV